MNSKLLVARFALLIILFYLNRFLLSLNGYIVLAFFTKDLPKTPLDGDYFHLDFYALLFLVCCMFP